MGYLNPLLKLAAGRAMLALPNDDRQRLAGVMRDLRRQADIEAQKAWDRRKGPMAAYWRAVATYARHVAHILTRAGDKPEGLNKLEIRRITLKRDSGEPTAWESHVFDGSPVVVARTNSVVRFEIGGNEYAATLADWKARQQGYVYVV